MALFLAGVMALSSAAADDDTALEQCVSIDDAQERLACYDAIAGRSSTEESVAAGPAITNDYGAEQLGTGSPDRKVEKPVSVKVTSCRKDASKRYYFHLENGQVWRQNDDDRLRLKECNFNATIVRDSFGYKLQIEGQKRRTRVKRVQ
ncbi:MAG: hypothetical protein OER91_04555 [Gammaproteobacteria bacterium]|nr:hypothetical protein [Gammaproteobacteria bacterium]